MEILRKILLFLGCISSFFAYHFFKLFFFLFWHLKNCKKDLIFLKMCLLSMYFGEGINPSAPSHPFQGSNLIFPFIIKEWQPWVLFNYWKRIWWVTQYLCSALNFCVWYLYYLNMLKDKHMHFCSNQSLKLSRIKRLEYLWVMWLLII